MPDPNFFTTAVEWRDWLAKHHDSESECLVGFIKATTGRANMTWSDAVDEALCFGWIDGVRRGVDAESYSIRFTPRKPGSTWSSINVKKIEALRAAGKMTEVGEAAFALRREDKTAIYSYERDADTLSPGELKAFTAAKSAWTFWSAQPPGYRKQATHWVTGAKREETRAKRFAQLIDDSKNGLRLRQYRRDA